MEATTYLTNMDIKLTKPKLPGYYKEKHFPAKLKITAHY